MAFGRRPDASAAPNVPNVERIMPYIMRGRNDSVFYLEMDADMAKAEPLIDRWNAEHPFQPITFFHMFLWAIVRVIHEHPDLNRFIAGGKYWRRNGIWASYVVKKHFADNAPIVTVKRRFDPTESFADMVAAINQENNSARKDSDDTGTEKELGFLVKLPGPVLRLGVRALNSADALGLLPKSFIDGDPMFTSVFVANLGSLDLDGGFHHLYEYGNCPIFCVIGRIKEVPDVIDGKLGTKRICPLRFTYDERTQDGYYAGKALKHLRQLLEDPVAAGMIVPD